MTYFENNHCEVCGVPIRDEYTFCREHRFNKCKCGTKKYRDDVSCLNCKLEDEKQKNGFSICPLCGEEFKFSEYLNTAILNPKTRLIANLITHYRHSHQKSWESQYKYISRYCNDGVYERAKIEHNNRAKRQILRKCKEWIKDNELNAQNFLELQDNDNKTIELINKIFQGETVNKRINQE